MLIVIYIFIVIYNFPLLSMGVALVLAV